MGSGNKGLYSGAITSCPRPVAGELVLRSKDYRYFDNIARRSDVDPGGNFDIVGHGSPASIQIEFNGIKQQLDARSISRILKHNAGYHKKQPIRLLSCLTGSKADGFAQNLANKLNTIVYAPKYLVWAYPDGRYIIAPRHPQNPNMPHPTIRGDFITFKPGGNKK